MVDIGSLLETSAALNFGHAAIRALVEHEAERRISKINKYLNLYRALNDRGKLGEENKLSFLVEYESAIFQIEKNKSELDSKVYIVIGLSIIFGFLAITLLFNNSFKFLEVHNALQFIICLVLILAPFVMTISVRVKASSLFIKGDEHIENLRLTLIRNHKVGQ